MLYSIAHMASRVLTKILFFLHVDGGENIPKTGGVILCANHRSCWDAVLISACMRRPLAAIGKEELFQNKLFAFVLRKLNCYPVKRGGGDLGVVKTAISLLQKGEALLIFPEGERIRKGKTPNPKPGAFRLAQMTGVPLVPMGIGGNFRLFRKMRIRVGTPIDMTGEKGIRYTDAEYREKIGSIMQSIYDMAETEQNHV